jgi:hypothetical protein
MALGIWLVVALTQEGYCYEGVFFKMMYDDDHHPLCGVVCAAIDVESTQQESNKEANTRGPYL